MLYDQGVYEASVACAAANGLAYLYSWEQTLAKLHQFGSFPSSDGLSLTPSSRLGFPVTTKGFKHASPTQSAQLDHSCLDGDARAGMPSLQEEV